MKSLLSRPTLLIFFALMFLGSAFSLPADAQEQSAKAQEPARVEVQTIAPRPEDVATIDGMLKAFYEVVSGPAGQPRQWARDRSLYIQGMRFVATGVGKDGKPYANVMDHQTFVDQSNPFMIRDGFYEREIHRVTRRFGNIAHVFSTYETRTKPDGPVISRGVNSLELFHDGTRWWIASAIWDGERAGNPIPKELLP
jgi:hypothetical protein